MLIRLKNADKMCDSGKNEKKIVTLQTESHNKEPRSRVWTPKRP